MGKFIKRRAARFFAVQAVYQLEYTDQPLKLVLDDFFRSHLNDPEHATAVDTDGELFESIVRGTQERLSDIDEKVEQVLAEGWTMDRMDAVVRAILRCAVFEFFYTLEVPSPVIMNEYIEVAKSFFADGEVSFINVALDRLGKMRVAK